MIERFDCGPRRRVITVPKCIVDHAVGRPPCAGCSVGEMHARYELARTWSDGAPVRWIGETDLDGDRDAHEASARAPRPTLELVVDNEPPRSEERSDRLAGAPQLPPRSECSSRLGDELGEAREAEVADEPKTYAKTCMECSEPFQAHGPSTRYCSDDCKTKAASKRPPAKPSTKPRAAKTNGAAKRATAGLKDLSVRSPKPASDVPAWAEAALDGIDKEIDAHEAELARLCRAGNAICDAAGITHRYEEDDE